MKTLLSLVFLLLALPGFSMGSHQGENFSDSTDFSELKYSYIVETDLSVEEFSEVFCERLSTKYNWHKVYSSEDYDQTYTSIMSFESGYSSWLCAVKFKKLENQINKILVVMIMDPYSDGL
jgi:hypothetical protein